MYFAGKWLKFIAITMKKDIITISYIYQHQQISTKTY